MSMVADDRQIKSVDQILLESLYAHGEFELVRAHKEARKRMAEAE